MKGSDLTSVLDLHRRGLASVLERVARAIGRRWRVCICALLLAFSIEARCEVVTFKLDPNRSRLELSGTVNAFGLSLALKPQGPESLIAPWKDRIVAEPTNATIGFIGGSRIKPMQRFSWEPDLYGKPGVAPASYGMLAAVNLGHLTVLGKAACRDWAFDVMSSNLVVQSGTFLSRRVRFPVSGTNSAVDYQFSYSSVPGDGDFAPITPTVISVAGRHYLTSGGMTNRSTNAASVMVENGVTTLTIPVDTYFVLTATNANHQFRFFLVFTGQLVGTLATFVDFVPPPTPGGRLKLMWPEGYKLQRATQYSEPNWIDFLGESPLEIETSGTAHFFRAVKAVE